MMEHSKQGVMRMREARKKGQDGRVLLKTIPGVVRVREEHEPEDKLGGCCKCFR